MTLVESPPWESPQWQEAVSQNPGLAPFFDNLESFVELPEGVEKLREMFLRLAVSGKLLPQVVDDKPASKILEKFQARWTDEGGEKRSRHKAIPPIEDVELEVPNNWAKARLGYVFEFEYGQSLPKKARVTSGKIPVYGSNGIVGSHNEAFANVPSIVVGRKGSSGAVNLAPDPFWPIDTTYFVTPSSGMDLMFSVYLLKSLRLDELGSSIVPGLNRDDAYALPVLVPPEAEQRRIVSKVEGLMSLCDTLESQRRARESVRERASRSVLASLTSAPSKAENGGAKVANGATLQSSWQRLSDHFEVLLDQPETLAHLRQSILQLAVQGKLVPQDPSDEPANTILENTKDLFTRLVKAKKLKKPAALKPVEAKDEPYDLPNGWAWCRFGKLLRISSGDGLTAKNMNEGTVPVYGGNGVTGHHDEGNVDKPTLVIGRVGFYCGSVHITPSLAWVTDNAFISTFDEEHMDMEYMHWMLKATDLRQRDNATAQPVISGRKVYPVILGIPPKAEQKRIVSKVSVLLSQLDELSARLRSRQSTTDALLTALIHQILEGTK